MRVAALHGLRLHLLILVVLASFPAFLLVAGLSIQRRSADTERVQADAVRVAMLASSELENLIAGTRNLLVGLSQVPDIRTAGPSCEATMREVHEQSPWYTVMGVALPDGRYVCSSIPSAVIDLSDRRHFRAAVDGKVLGIGDFVIGRTSGKASLNLALPMLNETGDVQSVVIAAIDLNVFSQLAARANLPDGSTVKVLDQNGTLLAAYPASTGQIGQSVADTPLFKTLAADGWRGTAELPGTDGRERLYAYLPLAPNEARSPTIAVGIPTEVAYGPANTMLVQGITGLIVIGGLAMVAAWLSGEVIILRRVERMLAATRRLASGDLEARTGITQTGGELGELAQAFDVMAEQLQRRDSEHREMEQAQEAVRTRLERESERLLTLHRVSTRLSSDSPDIETLLEEILQSAIALIGKGEGATLHVWEEDAQVLRRVHAWGHPANVPSHPAPSGKGLVGQVFDRGEPIVVDDYPAWSAASRAGIDSGVQRAFAVPLRHGGRRIGVLMIGSDRVDGQPFDADDVRLVGLLADQAAAALETTRLYVDIAAQLARMHALTRLNQVIFSTLDRETVLAEIARAAAKIFDAPFVAFWVLDPDTQTLRPRAFSNDAFGLALRSRTLNLYEAGFDAAEAGQDLSPSWSHVEITEIAHNDRIAMPSWWVTHGLKTYYGVPIVGDDRGLLGMLALYGRERFHFSPRDRELLDSFVALAAVAVRNASLYQAETEARRLAEHANHSKSEFLSRMSHELRTPLNAILGFSQLLEMSQLNAYDTEAVHHILTAGRHLLGLIDEVLDIERIESGHLKVTIEPVPLAGLVAELLDFVQPLAAGRAVMLKATGLEGVVVLADEQRLRQVLTNLLTNAVKYNREGGSVTLSSERTAEGLTQILVRDTGYGVAPDRMTRLFDPFDRLGAERTGVQGTGLGLTIARSLTEAMGGRLDVESVVGQGTTFWVELTSATGSEPAPASNLELLTPSGQLDDEAVQRRILYIEDSRPNALLVERSLAWRPQVQLMTAETGREGLALACEERPLMILADLHLPDMSGAEVLRHLQADARTADIPVVVVSADASREQQDRILAAGARSYLVKPFDVRALLGIVDEILQEAS
ncbi:MAG: GAF domain-containing protein [Chloroflexota bacterium]